MRRDYDADSTEFINPTEKTAFRTMQNPFILNRCKR